MSDDRTDYRIYKGKPKKKLVAVYGIRSSAEARYAQLVAQNPGEAFCLHQCTFRCVVTTPLATTD